nr:MAG TPA: hypothetical protein [Caudoviricetes sp.]
MLVSCLVKIIGWFYAGSTPAMSATRLTSRAGTGAPWSSSATGHPKYRNKE